MTTAEVTALFTGLFGAGGLGLIIRTVLWPWYKARADRQEKRDERLVKANEDIAMMVRETRQDVGDIKEEQARERATTTQILEHIAAIRATQTAGQPAGRPRTVR